LSALLNKGSSVDQKELDGLLSEIAKLDARITALLGPGIIGELDEQEKKLETAAKILKTKTELLNLRSSLITYYSDSEGGYPETLSALSPRYLSSIPGTELPWHAGNSEVTLAKGSGSDMENAITDTGGWLYFSDPKSPYFGMLIINCSHKDETGLELFKY
jgi:hypothetical protein